MTPLPQRRVTMFTFDTSPCQWCTNGTQAPKSAFRLLMPGLKCRTVKRRNVVYLRAGRWRRRRTAPLRVRPMCCRGVAVGWRLRKAAAYMIPTEIVAHHQCPSL